MQLAEVGPLSQPYSLAVFPYTELMARAFKALFSCLFANKD